MFVSFKTVGQLQVIHQPLYRPKQIIAGEYAVGRKIGLERVNTLARIYDVNNSPIYIPSFQILWRRHLFFLPSGFQ
jgi:hypothetical protein